MTCHLTEYCVVLGPSITILYPSDGAVFQAPANITALFSFSSNAGSIMSTMTTNDNANSTSQLVNSTFNFENLLVGAYNYTDCV